MKPLSDWPAEHRRNIIGVFTDIDDTLTTHGAISDNALQALADLKAAGLARHPHHRTTHWLGRAVRDRLAGRCHRGAENGGLRSRWLI